MTKYISLILLALAFNTAALASDSCEKDAVNQAIKEFRTEFGYESSPSDDIWILGSEKTLSDSEFTEYKIELQHHDGGYKIYTIRLTCY